MSSVCALFVLFSLVPIFIYCLLQNAMQPIPIDSHLYHFPSLILFDYFIFCTALRLGSVCRSVTQSASRSFAINTRTNSLEFISIFCRIPFDLEKLKCSEWVAVTTMWLCLQHVCTSPLRVQCVLKLYFVSHLWLWARFFLVSLERRHHTHTHAPTQPNWKPQT